MTRALLLAVALMFFSASAWAVRSYPAKGLVLKVDKPHNTLLISCERIPDYMDAMVMSFPVRNPAELASLHTGAMIEFNLIVGRASSYIEKIHIRRYESVEQDPISARRLNLVAGIVDPSSAPRKMKIGDPVPDFSLIDQNQHTATLSQFSGKVVAITFTYTHCALPDFCFRIANNFRGLQKRFANELGHNLILITITFDPAHDTPEVMAKYGKTWNANPQSWRLLTGSPSDIEKLSNRFGISVWPDEGLMTHSLHTFLVDRNGNLAADLEGNEFNADQLGDLVQTVLAGNRGRSIPDGSSE